MKNTENVKLTARSHELFMDAAQDAGNWGGLVPTDGNIEFTKEDRGNLTQLKKAGLVTTFQDEGCSWIKFTESGKAYAAENGVDLSWL